MSNLKKANRYFQPNTETWGQTPYMQKEWSVPVQNGKEVWLATMVVLPMPAKDKAGRPIIDKETGEQKTSFVPMGVRLECLVGSLWGRETYSKEPGYCFHLPGQTMFVKRKTGMCSTSEPYKFKVDMVGRPLDAGLGRPQVFKPKQKESGKPLDTFPAWVSQAVALATEAYEAHRAAARAA